MAGEKKEYITLVNKIVKTRDASNGIDNSGIIPFMYPDFIVKDELFFDYENNVIINAKYSPTLREELAHGSKNYIAICDSGMPDIDFTDRDIILQVLKDRHKGKFSQNKVKAMQEMSENEFWKTFKKMWVVNLKKDDEEEVSLFELYKTFGGPSYKILNMYFKLREQYSDNTIFSTTLGFIDKSLHSDKVSTQNGNYLKLLNNFNAKYGTKIQRVVEECYKMECKSDLDKQYRTLFLLKNMGGGNIL